MTRPPIPTHTPFTLAQRRYEAARRHDAVDPDEVRADEPRSMSDEAVPELIWLADLPDGLDAFAPEPYDGRPARARGPFPADETTPAVPPPPMFPSATVVADVSEAFSVRRPPRFDWMKRASRAAVLCVIAATAADWFFRVEPPQAALPVVASRVAAPPARRPAAAPAPLTPPAAPEEARIAVASPPVARTEPRAATPPQVAIRVASEMAVPPARRPVTAPVTAPAAPRVAMLPPPARLPAASPDTVTASAAPVVPPPPAAPAVAPSPADSAASPAPPVAASAPAVSAPDAPTTRRASADLDQRAIEAVLGRYRTAFNQLDAGAASAVWPTVNEKTLSRAFERLENQEVSFERCAIETAAVHAEAACSGTARYVPKVGNRTPKAEARQWRFSLHRAGDGWLIDSVDAR